MLRQILHSIGLPFLTGCTLFWAVQPGSAGNPGYRGNTSAFGLGIYSPAYYGYNLDEGHAGYYGGGRYREYYNFGRGYGLANYPGPLPGPGVPPDYRGSSRYPDYDPPLVPRYPVPLAAVPALPAAATANLVVEVPENAEIWFDGNKTAQTGASRNFVSPPLVPGRMYTYEIRARWKDNGRAAEQTQIVMVRAGEQVHVTFPAALPPRMLPPPKPLP
jgi:uncharacterized protein (TIGR03000 family)